MEERRGDFIAENVTVRFFRSKKIERATRLLKAAPKEDVGHRKNEDGAHTRPLFGTTRAVVNNVGQAQEAGYRNDLNDRRQSGFRDARLQCQKSIDQGYASYNVGTDNAKIFAHETRFARSAWGHALTLQFILFKVEPDAG